MAATSPGGWLWGRLSRYGLLIAGLVFLIDQAHKWWIVHVVKLEDKGRIAVAPFLDFIYTLNPGISYGLFPQAAREGQLLLAAFALLVALGLWIYLARGGGGRTAATGLGLIIGGAVANALDRLIYSGVVDYIQPHALGLRWPYIFNIADVAIVAGVGLLLYDSLWPNRRERQQTPAAAGH
ncbi:MAG: signal peptidase II [Hyphomicrobiaceae bacterium]